MKNILVTGGLGFIGSHYARLMTESSYDVTIIDKGTYASDIKRVAGIKCKTNIGDICDVHLVRKIIENNNIDTIVNFAADTHVDNAIRDSWHFVQNNYVGVWSLLEIVRNVGNIRFIQIGTDEVYGSRFTGSFVETDVPNPGNPYSATKASADMLVLGYCNTYGVDASITRSCNNYGPFQHSEKLIPRMIMLAMSGHNLEIYGNGTNVREWIYVVDNCLGIKSVMEKGIKGEIYNISSGHELSNNAVAGMIANKFGVGISYVTDRPGHDFRYSIRCDKIRRETSWEPTVNFTEGLEKTIKLIAMMANAGATSPDDNNSKK